MCKWLETLYAQNKKIKKEWYKEEKNLVDEDT